MDSAPFPPERIEAGRVLLRRLRTDDAVAVAEAVAASLAHLRPWMPWATPTAADPLQQRARIIDAEASWDAHTEYVYSAFRVRGDEFLGSVGLHRRAGPDSIEMGYWIHAAHAGRGYTTAAARALIPVAFALPGVWRVEIHCDVANHASAAIPRKLGFRLDRIEERVAQAASETGRHMIWVLGRQGSIS
ncbi:MAG: GNAT family N-acetyltransferase [Micromonosporaceae bacterium]